MENKEIENYKKAGKIAAETVAFARGFVKKNMLLIEIAEKIEGKISELGGECAFPVNLSLNEIAAHYTPGLNDKTIAQGILKIDLGVVIAGFIADTAFSLDLTDNEEFKEIIELNEKALDKALSVIKPGIKVNEIGKQIFSLVKGSKYSVIRNLSGHSLGEDEIHAGLTISNYENSNENKLNNIAIAIEPFLTTGNGEVYESSLSEIFMLQKPGSVRDREARKIIEFISENYKTRPFCKRWLERKFTKVGFILSQLTKQGILHNFPVLIEKSKKPVSQAEHTVIIHDVAEVTTK